MDKKQCEELISKLANKELSEGCYVEGNMGSGVGVEGKVISRTTDGFYANMWELVHGEKCAEHIGQHWSCKDFYHKYNGIIIGHEVYLGDVLDKMENTEIKEKITDTENVDCGKKTDARWWYQQGLLDVWNPCGFNCSLNQIMECGFEEMFKCPCEWQRLSDKEDCSNCGLKIEGEQRLKDPEARALFEFLGKLLLDKS